MFGISDETNSQTDFGKSLRSQLEKVHETARSTMNHNSLKMKSNYDLLARGGKFKEGDLVLLFNTQRKKAICPKIMNPWEGPYKIISKLNDVNDILIA